MVYQGVQQQQIFYFTYYFLYCCCCRQEQKRTVDWQTPLSSTAQVRERSFGSVARVQHELSAVHYCLVGGSDDGGISGVVQFALQLFVKSKDIWHIIYSIKMFRLETSQPRRISYRRSCCGLPTWAFCSSLCSPNSNEPLIAAIHKAQDQRTIQQVTVTSEGSPQGQTSMVQHQPHSQMWAAWCVQSPTQMLIFIKRICCLRLTILSSILSTNSILLIMAEEDSYVNTGVGIGGRVGSENNFWVRTLVATWRAWQRSSIGYKVLTDGTYSWFLLKKFYLLLRGDIQSRSSENCLLLA